MLVEPILCKNSWTWIPIGPPMKFWTRFPTWANNRNLNFQEKLQNGLCSCTSWSKVWHTIEMFDAYPESSWYKLLENTRKSWNNQKSYFTILDKNTQKRILRVGQNNFGNKIPYLKFKPLTNSKPKGFQPAGLCLLFLWICNTFLYLKVRHVCEAKAGVFNIGNKQWWLYYMSLL